MAMNRLSPEFRTNGDRLRFVFTERRSTKAAKHFKEFGQGDECQAGHLSDNREENLRQSDHDCGEAMGDPDGKEDFKNNDHKIGGNGGRRCYRLPRILMPG